MNTTSARQSLLDANLDLLKSGLNQGSTGNLSLRISDGFLITPSALPPTDTEIDDIVLLDWSGKTADRRNPSSEWRFHRDIYQQRPDIQAVVHTHSPWCTTLACLHREIPAFHYMVAIAGGDNIRCAPYARFGSQKLSDYVVVALENRAACLMANHRMLATGKTLQQALALTGEVEMLAKVYVQTLQTGKPQLLSSKEMQAVLKQFKQYRQQK